jgi:hypothetical protein
MAFGLMTTKWRIFRRPLEFSLEKIKKIIVATMRLHNFVLENDGLRLSNHESDIRKKFGVRPLRAQTGLDPENNGFLPSIAEKVHGVPLSSQQEDARRSEILCHIMANGFTRPSHNIERNA